MGADGVVAAVIGASLWVLAYGAALAGGIFAGLWVGPIVFGWQ